MATTSYQRRVIEVDVKGSAEAVRYLQQLNKSAAKTEQNLGKMKRAMDSLGNTIKAFIAYRVTAYISQIVPAVLNASEAMDQMYARLKLVARENENVGDTFDELFEIANRSRGSIESVSTLYTRVAAATANLNVEQEKLYQFTELVQSTFVLSGASASEAASGVTQLSQAMAKGRLDGDEFKSIMENNVYFGNLLAKTLGVTRGELLQMSKAGEITTEVLLEMGGNLETVQGQMSSMPLTISQLGTAVENTWNRLIGTNNRLVRSIVKLFSAWNDSVNTMLNDLDRLDEAAAEGQFQRQQKELQQLTAEYAKHNVEIGQLIKAYSLAQAGGVEQTFLDIYQGKVAQASVTTVGLRNRIDELRAALGKAPLTPVSETSAPQTPGALPPTTPTADSSKGKKRSQLQEEFNAHLQLYNRELERAYQLTQSLISPQEQLTKTFAEYTRWLDQGWLTQEQFNQAMMQAAEQYESQIGGIQEINKELEYGVLSMTDVMTNSLRGLENTLVEFVQTGKLEFKDLVDSIIADMARMAIQENITKPLFGFLGGLFANAHGNAFNGGSVVPFGKGGVVNQPTIFPMAQGAGVMGEAGTEGILPLTRTSNGDLGVKAEGAGMGNVTQNITVSGTGDENLIQAMKKAAYDGYQMAVMDVKKNGEIRRTLGV